MDGIRWWTVASAVAAPILLVGGWMLAAALQASSYDPIRDTISSLAAPGAPDRWVMSSALAGVGACYVATAAGFGPARRTGRWILASGGLATLAVAAFPQSAHGNSIAHTVAAATAFSALAVWPVFAGRRGARPPLLRLSMSVAATLVMAGLVAWFVSQLHSDHRGLAERAAAGMEALWPLAVVVTTSLVIGREMQP